MKENEDSATRGSLCDGDSGSPESSEFFIQYNLVPAPA